MTLKKLSKEFLNSEKAGGLFLVIVTILSLVLANSRWSNDYINFWNQELGGHTILHWINDGLMSIFFLLIGLELEHEIHKGELSNRKNVSLPIFAAIGGMVIPSVIFSLLNFGTDAQSGAGIPMATDIAFAIGILSLLGNRVPASLKLFLTTTAVIDDLGAIIIIAIFYAGSLSLINLLIALGIFSMLIALNKLKVYNLIPYLIGGIIMWIFMSKSGIHSTITGVLLAFVIPFRNGEEKSPSHILQQFLVKPVSFLIIPLFALANTCLTIDSHLLGELGRNYSIGIIMGLAIGKPLGIWMFSFTGVRLGLCSFPFDINWKNLVGTGFLAGIGFTMSIFISLLAFDNSEMINVSKIAILTGSFVSGMIGILILRSSLK